MQQKLVERNYNPEVFFAQLKKHRTTKQCCSFTDSVDTKEHYCRTASQNKWLPSHGLFPSCDPSFPYSAHQVSLLLFLVWREELFSFLHFTFSPFSLYPSPIHKEGRNYFNFLAIVKAATKKALLDLHTNFFSTVPSDSQSLRPTAKLSHGLGQFHTVLKHFPIFNIIQFTYPDHINYN